MPIARSRTGQYTQSELTGRSVSHFRVLEQLGAGGMGEVYKARDTHLDRLVALKFLPSEKVADPDRKRRLIQEARAASALNHPNIVQVYDIDTEDGIPFMAMEYVEGKSLGQLIPPTGLPLPTVLRYAIQIADGLARAHQAGIVHRDLKPANVMVGSDDRVKILDFGLAKQTGDLTGTGQQFTVTSEGTITGTAAYMSPEQAEGKPVDARSDIFSFGSVLYEMITGRPAFQAGSAVGTLSAILREDPRPLERVPPELAQVVARCLRKDPERRIQHMDDVRIALEEVRDAGGARTRRLRPAVIVASCAVVVTAVAAGWFLARREPEPEPASPPVPLTSYLGDEVQPSFSPDGNQVAFVWDGEHQDNPDIYIKLIGGAEKPLRLTSDPAADVSPAWSPDGRWIAFVRDPGGGGRSSGVYLVPAIGGSERLVTELVAPLASPGTTTAVTWRLVPFPLLAWAPGGQSLIIVDRGAPKQPLGLFSLSVATGEKRRLTSAPPGTIGDGSPAIAPDASTLLFSRATRITEADLYSLPLNGKLESAGEPKRLTSSKSWTASPAWVPGSREFLFTKGSIYLGPFSLWRMEPSGKTPPRLLVGAGGYGSGPALAPRGGRLVFSRPTSDSDVWRVRLDRKHAGVALEKLIASTREDEVPQYSPDGSRIVFTSNRSGVHEVWVCDADGLGPIQLTSFGTGMTGTPRWSPDQKQIVFDANSDGQFDVYTINAAGGSPRRLTHSTADDALAVFSPDGRRIYFASRRTGRMEIWHMAAEGGEPVQLSHNGGTNPVASPDGLLVYFWKARQLWSIPANGGAENLVIDSVSSMKYAVAASGIYFVPMCGGMSCKEIHFFDFAKRNAMRVVTTQSRVGSGMSVSSDEKYLLYTQIEQIGSDLMLVENFH